METNGMIKIGVTSGLRGIFPVMYDNDGPIQTGFTAKNYKEGAQFAIDWAKAEFGPNWEKHIDFDLTEK